MFQQVSLLVDDQHHLELIRPDFIKPHSHP
jgi:hypothetical protein